MRIDIHHHADQRVADKLDFIIASQEYLMTTISEILDDVQKQNTRVDSILALVSGLKFQLAEALSGTKLPPDVQARVDAIFPALEASIGKLDTAIADNTPQADPVPANDPVPVNEAALPPDSSAPSSQDPGTTRKPAPQPIV